MSDQFLGEIRMFAGNAIPKNWMACDGTILKVAQHTDLFSVVGTLYGGDGAFTFGIPDLRDAAALMFGQGPGISEYFPGEKGGEATVTLTNDQLPSHTHAVAADTLGSIPNPANADWAVPQGSRGPAPFYATDPGTPQLLNTQAISTEGGGAAHNNLMPYTVFVFCIATVGFPPPRT